MANRLLDRHEVVTIDGDVGYTPTGHSVTTANDNAFRRCSRQPRPARLPSRSQLRAPCADSWNSMAVDGARFVERGPCCRV